VRGTGAGVPRAHSAAAPHPGLYVLLSADRSFLIYYPANAALAGGGFEPCNSINYRAARRRGALRDPRLQTRRGEIEEVWQLERQEWPAGRWLNGRPGQF
jgi:hypothetical protein